MSLTDTPDVKDELKARIAAFDLASVRHEHLRYGKSDAEIDEKIVALLDRLAQGEQGRMDQTRPQIEESRTPESVPLSQASKIELDTLERAAQAMDPKNDAPCDCMFQNETGSWLHECRCQNSGDLASITLWCADKNNATIIRNLPLLHKE